MAHGSAEDEVSQPLGGATGETLFRALVERLPAVVYLTEADLGDLSLERTTYISPRIEELTGYAADEWTHEHRRWTHSLHPDDRDRVLEINERTFRTGERFSAEYRLVDRWGAVRWVRDDAMPLADDDSGRRWLGILVEITAEKAAEGALRESETRKLAVVEAALDALVGMDASGKITEFSPVAERMFGYARDEVVGRLLAETIVPPALRERHGEGLSRYLETGEGPVIGTPVELTGLRSDGTEFPVEVSISRLSLPGPPQFVGYIRDISERVEAAEALRRSEDRFRTLVERIPGVFYIAERGESGRWAYVSPQVEEMLGFPARAFMTDPGLWARQIRPEDRKRVLRMEERVRPGQTFNAEYGMLAADGRLVWVLDEAEVVSQDDGGNVLWGVLVDVTQIRRAAEDRRRAIESQLRLATRLEMLHELDRAILTATSMEQMAGEALDRIRLLIPFDRASIWLFEAEDRIRILAMRGVEAGRQPGDVHQVSPDLLADLRTDPVMRLPDLEGAGPSLEWLRWAPAAGLRSVVLVAMGAEGDVLGVLALFNRASGELGEDHLDVASEVAAQLAVGMRQQRLREDLAERAEQLARLAEERQQMLHRIVRAQEEERERVALELHDGLGQVLTSISLFASDLGEEVPEEAKPRAARVNELIKTAIADSRQLVWSLRPPELERLGLVPALRRMVEDGTASGLPIDLHQDIGDLRLAPEAEAVVYRVVQEAVNNAQKHAAATAVSILMRRAAGALVVLIEDNGAGFDPQAVAPGRGLGLIGMRERAELVSGTLVVESAVEAGTRIRLEVPITDPEGEQG